MNNRLTLALAALITAIASAAQVHPGVEVLAARGFAPVKGKRVALVTNPTGVDRRLRSTVDILHSAPGVSLVALLAPEHGVRGNITAGARVATETDAATGVKVHSLYGRTRKPTAEMLRDADVLVYDIQDLGCRSYTFISTLGLCMEACAEQGKEMVVLDRPNPLGGERVEGAMLDSDCRSFVSQYNIPYLYGLTPGELALYLNDSEFGGRVRLTVVPMEGWKRRMTYADTGLPWVLPSPHVPTPQTAMFYPATGILGELDYASVGVGYTMPFRLICTAWADADELARRLNALKLASVTFRPVHIKPYYGFGNGQDLHGVEVYINDPHTPVDLTLLQFYAMQELAAMRPAKAAFSQPATSSSRLQMFDRVCGSKKIRQEFSRRHLVADILPLWQSDFREQSRPYRLY